MIGPREVGERWLRRHAFVKRRALKIGAEAELLVHDADTNRPAPLHGESGAILPFLHSFAALHGWSAAISEKGAPRIASPAGGRIALEPGGQLEYATPPHASPRALHDDLVATVDALQVHATEHGLTLLAAGIDPHHGIDAAPLVLDSPRYRRMAEYFGGIGPAGARMMRQTAALQINIDVAEPEAAWLALNALSPVLVAAFANSRCYAGADTGFASYRAETWRHVDPARTGILPDGPPAAVYAAFALQAPAILLPRVFNAIPFLEHRRLGARADDWRAHLSTLFPEVRPRGYLEVRSIDAQPTYALAGPLLLVSAIAWDRAARDATRELLGPADPDLLAVAARDGVRDPRLSQLVEGIQGIALDGARRIGMDRYGEIVERNE